MRYELFKGVRALSRNPNRFRAKPFARDWIPTGYKHGFWPSKSK